MKQKHKEPMIPISGLYYLLKEVKQKQVEPLQLPIEWKKDKMVVFFNTLVKDGIAAWEKNEPASNPTPSV